MLNFNDYMARHGESWMQGLIEGLERREGVTELSSQSLEQRWQHLMQARANNHACRQEQAS